MGERHLLRQLVWAEPGELLDVVGGARLAVALDEPRQSEHEVVVVGLEMGAEPRERPARRARPLANPPRQPLGWLSPLLEEPPGQVQVAEAGLDAAFRQQHLAVALEHALDRRRGVRVTDRAAGWAACLSPVELEP